MRYISQTRVAPGATEAEYLAKGLSQVAAQNLAGRDYLMAQGVPEKQATAIAQMRMVAPHEPTLARAAAVMNPSFFAKNKMLLIVGGVALLGVLVIATRRKPKSPTTPTTTTTP